MSLYPRGRQQSRDRLAAKRAGEAEVNAPQHDFEPWKNIEPAGLSPADYIQFWRSWLAGMDMRSMPPTPRHMYQDNYDLAHQRIRYWSCK